MVTAVGKAHQIVSDVRKQGKKSIVRKWWPAATLPGDVLSNRSQRFLQKENSK